MTVENIYVISIIASIFHSYYYKCRLDNCISHYSPERNLVISKISYNQYIPCSLFLDILIGYAFSYLFYLARNGLNIDEINHHKVNDIISMLNCLN